VALQFNALMRAISAGLQPALDLDFISMAAAGALDPRITFSRGSTATTINSAGAIESIASDVPRFTHDPVTLAPLGLLIEEQRTNLLTWSDDLTQSSWASSGGTRGINTFTEDVASTLHRYFSPPADGLIVAPSATVTQSLLMSAGTRQFVTVAVSNGVNGFFAVVNTSTWAITQSGAAGSGVFVSATLSQATSTGERQFSIVGSIAGQERYYLTVEGAVTGTPGGFAVGYVGTGATIIARAHQLEVGASATSYIPTAGTSVVRSADSGNMDQSAGSAGAGVFRGFVPSVAVASVLIQWDNGSANNRVTLTTSAAGRARFQVFSGGVQQCDIDAGAITANTEFAVAASWDAAGFAAALNGAAAVTAGAGTVPTTTTLRILRNKAASSNGIAKRTTQYGVALPSPTLVALTA